MTALFFEGSPLLLQQSLFDEFAPANVDTSRTDQVELLRISDAIRHAFAAFDNEGALLVIEANIDETQPDSTRADILNHIITMARDNVRRTDIVERLDDFTIAIAMPGSGRIGMTRVADALRQRIGSATPTTLADLAPTTVTIGAVHTTESQLIDPNELLLAARVNLDSARAAGGNRTNWSDWTVLRPTHTTA